jgi:putative SOS response-associated peptidase YedK
MYEYADLYGLALPDVPPSYNVAPTQPVPVVRLADGRREAAVVRWGLVPSWSRDGRPFINAMAETAHEKPTFRAAFKRRRCLVVADGYFEWAGTGRAKQPYLFRLAGGEPFAFAGLWERWQDVEGCAILTTAANALSRPIHARMPVILPRDAYDVWLDDAIDDARALAELLRPYPAEAMECYPVSRDVGSPKNNRPDLLNPLPA